MNEKFLKNQSEGCGLCPKKTTGTSRVKGEGGLRKKGYFKRSSLEEPLVSVITVVLNGGDYLENTIQSVIGQTYKNVECIVVDGGSTDGTIDIIKKYDDQIDCWLSEPDSGIYDAMNKGINMATGMWINFMNSGDYFFDKETIQRLSLSSLSGKDLVYGCHEVRYKHENETFAMFRKSGDVRDLWKGMIFSHQSLFIKANNMIGLEFETNIGTSADYDLICKMRLLGCEFFNSNQIIASVSAKGISDIERINSMRSARLSAKKINRSWIVDFYYTKVIMILWVKETVKRLLPKMLEKWGQATLFHAGINL